MFLVSLSVLYSEFWSSQLPDPEHIRRLADGVTVKRGQESKTVHAASGSGCWGKLTSAGLLQMVDLGRTFSEIVSSRGYDPSDVRWVSTDFQRTLESLLGVLAGFYGDGDGDGQPQVEVDATRTSRLIPDPQPRLTEAQAELEGELVRTPDFKSWDSHREADRIRLSDSLSHLLSPSASSVSFGVGEEGSSTVGLQWAKLSEVLKCLETRGLLPPTVGPEDVSLASAHAAARWFKILESPRMKSLLRESALPLLEGWSGGSRGGQVTIVSAHDSTIIMYLAILGCRRPKVWPGYGAYMEIEVGEDGGYEVKLNGEVVGEGGGGFGGEGDDNGLKGEL
ncbi:hypothetical protein TrRE_jg4647 [Triparma retinervis]|uniref:Acid phosphatase n=1 Tax=Triparma retinervis TaxID=2557542 RepID=A0A9W7A815_9STRA|nr:hypothetical protein TrRE_jg4647 [Triparma retinervis]